MQRHRHALAFAVSPIPAFRCRRCFFSSLAFMLLPSAQPPTLHLWQINLDSSTARPSPLAELADHLTAPEQQRLQALRRIDDQRRFGRSRAVLRQVLAAYLHIPPLAVPLAYGPQGKPYLATAPDLHFNLSHSGDWAILVCAPWPVGVDVEQVRPLKQQSGLIRRCLTRAEQQAMARSAPKDLDHLFFRYWTCKEAHLKATGEGLQRSMQTITVDFEQGHPHPQQPQFLLLPLDAHWQSLSWAVAAGVQAAMAIPATVNPTTLRIMDRRCHWTAPMAPNP